MDCALNTKLFRNPLFALLGMVGYACVIQLLFSIIHLSFIFGV
jgi:hypothetical protein